MRSLRSTLCEAAAGCARAIAAIRWRADPRACRGAIALPAPVTRSLSPGALSGVDSPAMQTDLELQWRSMRTGNPQHRGSHVCALTAPRDGIEGRDQTSGDRFIDVGEGDQRRKDMYVSREVTPAGVVDVESHRCAERSSLASRGVRLTRSLQGCLSRIEPGQLRTPVRRMRR